VRPIPVSSDLYSARTALTLSQQPDCIVIEGSRLHQEGIEQLNDATNALVNALTQLSEHDRASVVKLQEQHADAVAPMSNSYANYELAQGPDGSSQRETATMGDLATNAARKLDQLEAELGRLWNDYEKTQMDVDQAYKAVMEIGNQVELPDAEANQLTEDLQSATNQLISEAKDHERVSDLSTHTCLKWLRLTFICRNLAPPSWRR
jgi:hypothetical protein